MDYYKQIKDKILNNEAYERIKDYSKERHRVLTYFEIGKLLHEAGKHYGEGIIRKYSLSLEREFGKKFNNKSVKKTLSIPEWLNDAAIAKNINFSNVLQEALISRVTK